MPGTKPNTAKMPEEMNKALGLASWLEACSVMDSEVVTRVTMMAVANDSSSEGIWATKPSPMVSNTYNLPASLALKLCCNMPMAMPPTKLMSKISKPAMASPLTNLDAPSMAPKKSDSWDNSSRRFLAVAWSIMPAFKSASMAICLPGMASKVNRAFTSETRPAPLVTTMKLMIIKIAKMMKPTT